MEDLPRLHLGPILSGRAVCKDDTLRQLFSQRCSARAWDPEFDSVIESVMGNCKDSFALVRGNYIFSGHIFFCDFYALFFMRTMKPLFHFIWPVSMGVRSILFG